MPRGGHRETAGCGKRLHAVAAALALALTWLLLAVAPAEAQIKTIDITEDGDRLDISQLGEFHEPQGDQLTVEMATGGGVPQRVKATASFPGTNPAWFSFALRNTTDKQIERWLVVDRYNSAGSGVVWPDLDARRVEKISHSLGYAPLRIRNDRADIFRLTLEPGQTVTYIAELTSDRFARLHLWNSLEYEQRDRDRQLFYGIMLGITGLLAIFLTAVFAANHKAIFPSAAIFTWCVLAYLCVDFGFWQKLFSIRPEENAQYRAATEAAMVASLLAFLYVFLRLGAWHGFVRTLIWLWIAAQAVLVGVAFLDPRLAATFARLSSVAIGGWGAVVMLFLALRGQDRALSLVPTWMLLLVWLFGAGTTLIGRLGGDFPVFLLTAGLVLIVVLLGFTVTQYVFRSQEPQYGVQPGEQQLRALAVDGAGAAVWEWSARRDEIKVSQVVETMLGLKAGELSTRVESFAAHMHPADRERFKLLLWSMNERAGGEMRIEFRMRHVDNSYRWFELDAAGVPTSDRRNLRCVGLLREVTDAKRAQERLLHNAVHDSLSGLPNRELFLDRLAIATKRATLEPLVRPSLLFIDIDKFKSANTAFGLVVGDSLLLTVARRLARNLGPQDTLARTGGDQFAMLLLNQTDPRELAMLAEQVRRSIRSPINIAGQGVVLTASIGIAFYDGPDDDPAELLREAEIAMYRAKRSGSDRVEIFNAEMRAAPDDRVALEDELRSAIEKKQLRLVYQPIFYLPTETLAGFEALLRWEHPRLGTLNPTHFVPVAEESDLIVKLGSYALTRAVREAQRWQRELPRPDQPLFVSVNVSSRQLFRPELINEVRHILGRAVLPKGSLRLELTEALAMENPERAISVLEQLSAAGTGLALDGFATGYSSFSYLNQFTFDAVKVDPAFVQGRSQGGSGAALLRSIVALAHELGKNVVAEGVEAEEDVGFLRSIGCEFAQGTYYGDAMSERDVLQLLKVVRRAERRLKKSSVFRQRAKARSDAAMPPPPTAATSPPAMSPPPQPPVPQAAPQHRPMPMPPRNGSRQPLPTMPAAGLPPQTRPAAAQASPPLPLRAPPGPLAGPSAPLAGLQKAGGAPTKPPVPPPADRRPAAAAPPPVPKAPAAPSTSEKKPGAAALDLPRSPLRSPPPPAPANGKGKPHPAAAPKAPGVVTPPAPSPASAPPTRTARNVFNSGPAARPPFLTGGGPPSPPSQNARPAQPQPAAAAPSPARPRAPGPDLSKLPPAIRASLAKLAGELAPEDEKPPPGSPPPSTST